MDTKDNDIKKRLKKIRADHPCAGGCNELAYGAKMTIEKCTDPCNQRLLDFVTEEAKANAKRAASVTCQKQSPYCVCLGEYFELVPAICVPVTKPGWAEFCLYIAVYQYSGECRLLL